MEPYTITQATLVTYSGKRVPIIPSKEIFTKPIRIFKDAILDGFVKACKGSKDPFVRIEVRTQPVFQPLNR